MSNEKKSLNPLVRLWRAYDRAYGKTVREYYQSQTREGSL